MTDITQIETELQQHSSIINLSLYETIDDINYPHAQTYYDDLRKRAKVVDEQRRKLTRPLDESKKN